MVTFNGGSAASTQVIASATTTEDHTLRRKKKEGDEGLNLNTVECLRGRLLAERHASRVAKEEEESMSKKLVEVEKLLREEIRLRDKAERKLKFLRKKLESSNKHSDSSEICEKNSCGSSSSLSSTVTSISKHSEALQENVTVQDHDHVLEASKALIQTQNSDSQINDNSSCSSEIVMESTPNQSPEDLKNDESRFSSLSSKASVTEDDDDKGNLSDNSMAIVPVNVTATSHASNNSEPVNESVLQVLGALKHARERLQGSMGSTSQMIHVGPT